VWDSPIARGRRCLPGEHPHYNWGAHKVQTQFDVFLWKTEGACFKSRGDSNDPNRKRDAHFSIGKFPHDPLVVRDILVDGVGKRLHGHHQHSHVDQAQRIADWNLKTSVYQRAMLPN